MFLTAHDIYSIDLLHSLQYPPAAFPASILHVLILFIVTGSREDVESFASAGYLLTKYRMRRGLL